MELRQNLSDLMTANENEIVTFIFPPYQASLGESIEFSMDELSRQMIQSEHFMDSESWKFKTILDREVKNGEPRMIRALKSKLIEVSPVFKTMFSEAWDKNRIEMNDHINFDGYYYFKHFSRVLFNISGIEL